MHLERLPAAATDRIADAVYERIRDAIFAGALPPGARLSVPALADRLGVSRSPVREAVARLTHDRLAVEEPRRGAVVARIELTELIRIYEVRGVLEGLAASLAARRGDPQLAGRLAEVLHDHERAVTAGDIAAHTELDIRFHSLVRHGCGNPEVARALDDIQVRVRLAMLTTTVTAGPPKALADHQAIYQAIRDGDPDRAEHCARAHISRLREALLSYPDIEATA